MKKSVLVILSIVFFSSCSKDDEPTPQNSDAKYRIEITHEGNRSAFTEFLTVSLVSPTSEATITANDDFEAVEQVNDVYSFFPTTASNPIDRIIQTSPNVQTVVVSLLMNPIDMDSKETFKTTVSLYKNDVWIKSATRNFKGLEYENFNVTSEVP